MKQKVISLPPQSHVAKMFSQEVWDTFRNEFEVIENPTEKHLRPDDVSTELPNCDAMLTGWGAVPFSKDHFSRAGRLKLIAHTAGSVKYLFPGELVSDVLIPKGISIFSGNEGIAINVAEATIGLMISTSRKWNQHIARFRNTKKKSDDPSINGQFLIGATVGIISASMVARYVLPLLAAFRCKVLLYDPILTPETIRSLGAEPASLNEIFEKSDIVSVHAPELPATRHMVNENLLKRLRDGATFINTSRGSVVDHNALLAESKTGRIQVALDVTEPEPLPPESEFWDLPNVTLLPHIVGQGRAGFLQIGEMTLEALRLGLSGKPYRGRTPLDRWSLIA